ncbi:MAG: hypothetical protein HY827_04200 [Actinobacteria bacterium]|nr:hypothetical protein [Actinomycetota bacterium]
MATLVVAVSLVVLASTGGRSVKRPNNWFAQSPEIVRETLAIDSRALDRRIKIAVLLPRGYAKDQRRSLLVLLHGRGSTQEHLYDAALLKALAGLGDRGPVVALPYGGEHSYWHDRADADWGRYVSSEVIPAVRRRYGTDRRRVAIGGVSMGGFGALDLARLHPGRFCAVGGHSPALWQGGGESAAGAFDDAADFARHDVIGAARSDPDLFGDTKVWLDAGDADPFQPGVTALRTALRSSNADLTFHTWPGAHEVSYTDAHYRAYLRFYAHALATCD